MPESHKVDRSIYLEERRDQILDLLDRDNAVNISDLSNRFQVSSATIRKDIRALERDGKLRRTHGGAIKQSAFPEPGFETAEVSAHEEKVRIGRAAAEFVSDGDTILVQSGTTCRELVRALEGRRGLTLILSDIAIALEAERILPDSDIILLGGKLRTGYHYAQGIETARQLRRYHVPLAFLGCNALSFEYGATAHRIEQATWMREQLEASDRHIMLLDSSKIGAIAPVFAADLAELDVLITDSRVNRGERERFAQEARGLEVIYA